MSDSTTRFFDIGSFLRRDWLPSEGALLSTLLEAAGANIGRARKDRKPILYVGLACIRTSPLIDARGIQEPGLQQKSAFTSGFNVKLQ